jgi:RimJ/RimL family protein N-acetyltransferase
MPLQPIILEGTRARLTPMARAHADALYAASRDPRIWRYMPQAADSPADMAHWMDAAFAEWESGKSLPFVIEDRKSDRIVGSTRLLDYDAANRGIEIGHTWLNPDAWRTRINTECKHLLLRHCFETLNVIRVQLKTDSRNVQSQAAIERIGGVREGVLRHHRIMPDGYLRDSVYFSILAEEWPAVEARLERFLAY